MKNIHKALQCVIQGGRLLLSGVRQPLFEEVKEMIPKADRHPTGEKELAKREGKAHFNEKTYKFEDTL